MARTKSLFRGALLGVLALAASSLTPAAAEAGPEFVVADLTLAPAYQAVPVARLADTRGDLDAALQVPLGRLTPGFPLVLELAGVAGIPDEGVAAVDLNIAVTAVERTGFLAVYPCAAGNDGTARLNYTSRPELGSSAIAVQVLAQLDDTGATCIEASAPAHVIVDTSGFLTEGGPLRPIPAARLFDTRTGVGSVEVIAAKPAVKTPFPIKVAGIAGVPESGAAAVLLSVAAVKGTAPGFVSVFPCTDGYQGTANLNHRRTDPVANLVIAPLDENGEVCFYNSTSVDLVVDVSAWFATGDAYSALKPSRAADTRDGVGDIPIGKLTPFDALPIQLGGVGGVPTQRVEAVSLNVAVARGERAGFLAIFPCDEEWNGTASLNFQAGEPISNAALTPIAADGTACVLANRAVDVIIDVNGWVGPDVTAIDDEVTIGEDSGINQIDVLGNDVGTTEVTDITRPTNGSVAITNGGDDLRYIPPADFCTDGALFDGEPETFTYTAQPGDVTATVSVTVTCVDDPPVAVADTATVTEDSGANQIDVLANDTDIDLGPKSISSVTQPAQGAVVLNGTELTYTPDPNACNDGSPTDDVGYTLSPGNSTATVSVTVVCVDDEPVAVDDSFTVAEDAVAAAVTPLSNDTDVDSGPSSIGAVTQPANGTVSIANGGQDLTYDPDANYCNDGTVTDDFDYTLAPGGDTATISMTVTCVNDTPVAIDDAFTSDNLTPGGPNDRNAIGNTTLKVGVAAGAGPERMISGSLLDNDADGDDGQPDADTLTVTATGDCAAPAAPTTGTVSVNADGTFTYDPEAGFDGTDCFAYTITDGVDTSTAEATIEVADIIWYVDSSVDTVFSGSGTSGDPYSETDAVRSTSGPGDVDEPGDTIFLYQGTSDGTAANAYQNGLAIEDDQQVIGEPAGLSVDGVDLVPPEPGFPEITGTVDAAIRPLGDGSRLDSVHSVATGTIPGIWVALASDVELHDVGHSGSGSSGLYLSLLTGPVTATGTISIEGDDVLATGILFEDNPVGGTVTIADVDVDDVAGDGIRIVGHPTNADGAVTISDGTIDGSTGYGVNVVDGNGNVTIDADIGSASSNTGPVRVFDRKGGAVSFGGSITDSSDANLLIGGTNNTGSAVGAVSFTGSVVLESLPGGTFGTGIQVEGANNVPAADAALSVDFDGSVQVNGKILGASVRVTGDASWPIGTRTVSFDGGLTISTGATAASGLFVDDATVEIADAVGVFETITTDSGKAIDSTNGSGTLTLDSVSGASMIVQHFEAEPIQHVDIDTITMTGGTLVTVFVGGTSPGAAIDSLRIGGGTIASANGRGLGVQGIPSVDIDLTSIDVASDGASNAAVFVSGTGGDIDVGTLAIDAADGGLILEQNNATISFGSIDIGDIGLGPTGRGVSILNSSGAIDLGVGDITSTGGDAIVIDGGSNDVTYNGTITNSTNRSVLVRNRPGGDIEFGGLITHTGTSRGIDTNSNAAASRLRFTGGLDITSSTLPIFLGTGVHEIVDPAVGSNQVAATGGAAAVFITNATIGAGGVTFESVDAASSTDGIVLNIVDGPGTFSVTGTGGDDSGGTMSVFTNGVELTSVAVPVEVTELSIAAQSGSGIVADRSSSLTVDGVEISRWASSAGNAGISSIGFEAGSRSVTLQGTDSRNVISNVPSGSVGSGVALTASSGDYDITVDQTDFSSLTDGISLKPTGTARVDAVVGHAGASDPSTGGGGRVTSTGATGAGLTMDVGPSSSTLLVDELSTIGVPGASFDSGIILTSGAAGQLDAVIEDSLLGGTEAHRTNGLFVGPGDGTIRTTVRRTTAIADVFDGMRFVATAGGALDATIVDSTASGITDPSSTGVSVLTTNSSGNLCLDATSNTFSGVDNDVNLSQSAGSTFDVAGLTGGADAAAVDAFLQVTNANAYSSANSTFIGASFGSAACAAPVVP